MATKGTKQPLHTSMLGRKVRLGWSTAQTNAWVKANSDSGLSVPIIPAIYAKHGQAVGEVVNVYLSDGTPTYDVLVGTDLLVGLNGRHNISEVLPEA